MFRNSILIGTFFSFFLVLQLGVLYYLDPEEKVKAVLYCFVGSLVVLLIAQRISPSESELAIKWPRVSSFVSKVLGWVTPSFILVLLFVGYLEFYFTVDRSITFRMLIITSDNQGTITAERMLKLYNTDDVIISRLDDLVYGGYLSRSDGDYFITPKGRFLATGYRHAMKLLNLENSYVNTGSKDRN
jgi:hypothetical protein